jgi:hypothetical protein
MPPNQEEQRTKVQGVLTPIRSRFEASSRSSAIIISSAACRIVRWHTRVISQ